MANAISWFEIPVEDMDRAVSFYSTVLGIRLEKGDMMGTPYTFFPADQSGVGGALVQSDNAKPSMNGALVYLTAGDDLSSPLAKIETAGGHIIVPKTDLGGGMGYFALFQDSEGNRVGLYSMH